MIFRAVLVSLSALYQQLLELLREVARAQPMPFLKDFYLPADMTQFLHPSDAFALIKQAKRDSPAKGLNKGKEHSKKSSVKVKNQGQSWKIKEDLGVAVERGVVLLDGTAFKDACPCVISSHNFYECTGNIILKLNPVTLSVFFWGQFFSDQSIWDLPVDVKLIDISMSR